MESVRVLDFSWRKVIGVAVTKTRFSPWPLKEQTAGLTAGSMPKIGIS